MKINLVLIALATFFSHINGESHQCIHDKIIDDLSRSVDHDSRIQPQYKKRNLVEEATVDHSDFQPIRITFDTSKLYNDKGRICSKKGEKIIVDESEYECSKDDELTVAKIEMIENVLLVEIRNYFGSILSVQRVQGNLMVYGLNCHSSAEWACCSGQFPSHYSINGVADTDYLVHVTARPTQGTTIAWALPCSLDEFGRPISGQINFGSSKIDPNGRSRNEQIGTALHEMSHALGFSKNRFYDFRRPLNGPRWEDSNIFLKTVERDAFVTKLITPKIIEQVKKHFDCQNWPTAGAELENGADGSIDFSSHWEKRLFNGEYMTATTHYDPIYSALTLALFEDSGWYTVNYEHAELLPWGYHEGCSFANSQCSDWTKRYFCTKAGEQKCTPDLTAKGYCSLVEYSASIPSPFQYFADPTIGGADKYEDYCPLYKPYSNGDCRGSGQSDTFFSFDLGEEIGSSSRCFESTLHQSKSGLKTYQGCYAIKGCSGKGLEVSVNGKIVYCPLEGGEIVVPGFNGKLICPEAFRLCQQLQDTCSGRGILLSSGECSCNPGFTGVDCSTLACPKNNLNEECSGKNGVCNRKTGSCVCLEQFTGLACSDLVCPSLETAKIVTECSGRGICNRISGLCTCNHGYSGNACECVPGCHLDEEENRCSRHGTCDCTTGGCSCSEGYSGSKCETKIFPTITEIMMDTNTFGIVEYKEYKYYKVYLSADTYDVSIVLISDNEGKDPDLYASFAVEYPHSLLNPEVLLSSNRETIRDEIHLCGNYGVFPRGVNDTFRYCSFSSSEYVDKTPGWFYIAVFGFSQASFSLKVETDKCKNENCSGHGTCGKEIAGVCKCDRLWSGEICSVPQCRPDCLDKDITCTQTKEMNMASHIEAGLRQTKQCYGNGECHVYESVPTCFCDDTHKYDNPMTPEQSLCRDLIPSIFSIQHFNDSFHIVADTSRTKLDLDSWAMYTIQIDDKDSAVLFQLSAAEPRSDPMLYVRKGKPPTLDLYPVLPIQYMDSMHWTTGDKQHQILLTREASSLSSGLYYIGVFNGRYARSQMSYLLNVEVANSCNNMLCSNHGSCNLMTTPTCTCEDGYGGEFCEFLVSHHVLSIKNRTQDIELARIWENETLLEGQWKYISFEIKDNDVKAFQVRLEVTREYFIPPQPLLLLYGPDDAGFPRLDRQAQTDIQAVANKKKSHMISMISKKSCSGKNCYKIAIYNHKYSSGILEYTLRIDLLSSILPLYSIYPCKNAADANERNCNGKGTCVDTISGPQCACQSGWHGINCKSPKPFDIQQLWHATKNITLLCSVCQTKISLKRGQLKIFRVPQPLKPDTGLRIRVSPIKKYDFTPGNPNIYISEILPRSIYDFSLVSITDREDETIDIQKRSSSGQFWVAVYSETETTSTITENSIDKLEFMKERHLNDEINVSQNPYEYLVQAQLLYVHGLSSNTNDDLITKDNFFHATMSWMVKSPIGAFVIIIAILFMMSIISFCIWRSFHAPDHQDKVIKTYHGKNKTKNWNRLVHQERSNLDSRSRDFIDDEEEKEASSLPVAVLVNENEEKTNI